MKILLIMLFSLMLSSPAYATEEYARTTGKECGACHVDPAGGGDLTAFGKTYGESAAVAPPAATPITAGRLVRVAMGYLHIITAFLWFGTILYVHLVLKPAYAAKGLPKGEVRVGLVSMAVMGATGIYLTVQRIPSLQVLFHTRFGILLCIKVALFLVMVTSAMAVVLIIGPRLRRRIADQKWSEAIGGPLTAADLGRYDGLEGRPCYFAYAGRVFDASASRLWKNGRHMGRHPAGMDLTEALSQAPHGEDRVLAMPVVAELAVAAAPPPVPLHQRVFYFMAYMNLCMVFSIVFILALWRWL